MQVRNSKIIVTKKEWFKRTPLLDASGRPAPNQHTVNQPGPAWKFESLLADQKIWIWKGLFEQKIPGNKVVS